MTRVHLDQGALKRAVADQTGAAGVAVAVAIAKAVRAQGIKVSSSGGGPDQVDLPVKVFANGGAVRDMVSYTTKAGTSRLATRAQALSWGGSFEEITTSDHEGIHVVLAHPAGKAVQARHGALTKAAASVGLEVRS